MAATLAAFGMQGLGRRLHSRLSPQEEEIIRVSFESFSEEVLVTDPKTGLQVARRYITTENLQQAFREIDASGDIHDIQLLIDDIDEDGDGKIDEEEWRGIMSKKFLGEDDDSSLVHVFQMLDDDKDGYIPLVELRTVLMREGQSPLSEQEVDELLMFADLDNDGLINYRSFLHWLANPQAIDKREEKRRAEERARTEARPASPTSRGGPRLGPGALA